MKMKHFVGLTAAVLGVVLVVNAADVAKVSDEDGRTAQRVAGMIKAQHINHPDLDDEISTHLLDRYIKVWDPQKLYFLKSDVDEFRKSAEELDDEIKAGDVEFANKVFARFIDRMNEHGPMISAHINAEHDFTADEEMTLDADDIDWAADKAALKERWRKRIKYEILNLRLEDTEAADIKERLEKRYSRNRKLLAQTESHEILELYLSSLTHCLDPHTSYMSPQTLEDFRINMELKLEGETIRDMDIDIGYLHRGFEIQCEHATWTQILPYTDRLNYLSSLCNNVGYTMAVEKLLDEDVHPLSHPIAVKTIPGQTSARRTASRRAAASMARNIAQAVN